MKNLSKFFENVFDVDYSDDLVNQILKKYTAGTRVFDNNMTISSINLDKHEISVILVWGYFEPTPIPANKFFRDMDVAGIEYIHLEDGGEFMFDNDIHVSNLHIFVPKEDTICLSAERSVIIDGFNILQSKIKYPTRIHVNNEKKFTLRDCTLQCHTVRLENPELVSFKNCKFEWYDKAQFEITDHSRKAIQAYEMALNDDYSGFEKLGFASSKLNLNNFTLLYINTDSSLKNSYNNLNADYFFYKNGKWSKGNKNPGEQKFYMG